MDRTIYVNEDNHHFYGCHPAEDMSPEGIDRLVDFYVQDTQVAGVLFCTNVQRALFDSQAWETFWADYDPAAGPDQPCLLRSHGAANHLLLRERGLDQHARWLARCEHHGVEGWLTMRMNDCHGLKEYEQHRKGLEDHTGEWTIHWASTYWREHPELRRASYRLERSWEEAFDYGQQAVRDYHLALVRELADRYDMFGLELDWQRWTMMFKPGHEQAGAALLTDFVRQVRAALDACAERVGHPVQLAHRLPADPQACLDLGYDPITWAREGLADMVVLSSFLGGANFNYPIAIWRRLLGPDVKLIAHAESVAQAYPEQMALAYEFLFGGAAAALERGADGVYLFNTCYRESDAPELMRKILTHAGARQTLARVPRRQAVTFPQIRAAGGPLCTVLPIPLTVPEVGRDLGRMEQNVTVRISLGGKPTGGRACLRLGFSATAPRTAMDGVTVRLNTVPVAGCAAPVWEDVAAEVRASHGWPDLPAQVAWSAWYDLPLAALHADVNAVEFAPPALPGALEWAEIVVLP